MDEIYQELNPQQPQDTPAPQPEPQPAPQAPQPEPQPVQVEQPVVQATVEAPKQNNTLGIISLVCGILSVVFACCCAILAYPTAIAAIVCAVVEKNKTGVMSTFAKIGLGIGIAGFVFGLISSIIGAVIGATGGLYENFGGNGYYY